MRCLFIRPRCSSVPQDAAWICDTNNMLSVTNNKAESNSSQVDNKEGFLLEQYASLPMNAEA